jgi:hypothetical protein
MSEQLTAQEAAWLDELTPRVLDFKQNWQGWPADEREAELSAMCELAEGLHRSLESRGLEPQHSKTVTANRAADVQHSFYFNLHALEDLIGFTGTMKRPGSQASTM